MTSALNILTLSHLYPNAAYPGSGPFVKDEVREHARRHTVGVVAPLPWHLPASDAGRRIAQVPYVSSEDGIRVIRPRLPGVPVGGRIIEPWLWAVRLRPVLREACLEMDADLVHAHFGLPDGFAAAEFASRADLPLVLTLHGSDVLVSGDRPIARGFLRRALNRARAIIAVSEEIAERAQQLGAGSDQIRVITGGVPYPAPESHARAKARFDLAQGSISVLWLGALSPLKQPLDAVEAFAHFAASCAQEPSLFMIGDGPLRGVTADLVRERGLDDRIHLLGRRARGEVWHWLCAGDLLINSSRTEGTPLSVLEALGAGAPVAAYPLPGIRAVVDATRGGSMAEEATPAALAIAMADALATAKARDALASDARARFDIVQTARAVEDVYAAVV